MTPPATGESVVHTYRQIGTFTVSLTVNDGFGGISTATASITVQDVPPAFVPKAFLPPLTFAAPTTGDGFGTSVASVAGNAAIGAPMRSAPARPMKPARSTCTTATRATTAFTRNIPTASSSTSSPIRTPRPGDEFGAAIATVGTDLLIGAPGSSLTGPGDGVAYLFDADPTDPNFGALLATLDAARSRRGGRGAFRRGRCRG